MSAGTPEAIGFVEQLAAQLPILQVLVPMLTAPLCVLVRRPRISWLLALAATWGCAAISILLLQQTLDSGPISYHVGGWPPPWGIEIRIDQLNAFVLMIVSLISAVVLTSAPHSLVAEVPTQRHYLVYAAYSEDIGGQG